MRHKRTEKRVIALAIAISMSIVPGGKSLGQPEQNLAPVFESAAAEFGVPSPILEGIAFVDTRWAHIRPHVDPNVKSHMPPAYGVMALRDDPWFGHSLMKAAELLGVDVARVKDEIPANIRGAAAYLRFLATREPKPPSGVLESWMPVVARYSGIHGPEEQGLYVEDVFRVLRDGYNHYGIVIETQAIDWGRVTAFVKKKEPTGENSSPRSDDYPPAVWDPSPNFSSRSGSPISHVIVHDTEGSFAGSVDWLKNPAAQASAHYIFRSSDGYLKQLVREADKAWHVVCWNSWTVGIEHEGYVDNPAWFTDVMYRQSALLTRHLCGRYGLSKDRLRIVGHDIWRNATLFPQLGWDNCNNHSDPGQFWNWDYYLALIVNDSTPPRITGYTPGANQQNVPVYKNIVITFDRAMHIPATQSAFSLFPQVPGAFRWSSDGKTMTFDPSANLTPAETYMLNLQTTAKGSGGGGVLQPLHYVFTTAPRDTIGPRFVRSYPTAGQTGISPAAAFQVWFDEPVVFASFSGRVRLSDVADSSVLIGLTSVAYTDIDDKGYLTFAASADLQLGHTYRLRLLPGLRDPLGNLSSTEARIEFTIQPTGIPQGSVVDGFEDNRSRWQRPSLSDGSVGIDTVLTDFTIPSLPRRSGSSAGKLVYGFTDTAGGLCRVRSRAEPRVVAQDGWVGMWIYGDNSGNRMEWWFTLLNGGTQHVSPGMVDWFGWRFVNVPTSLVGNDVSSLNSVTIRQQAGAQLTGAISFDDLQVELLSSVEDRKGGPVAFALAQNYPNPFNPATRFRFSIPASGFTSLKVFDVLGREAVTLVEGVMTGGTHEVHFDARGLASGIYFYRLQSGGAVATKKLIVVK